MAEIKETSLLDGYSDLEKVMDNDLDSTDSAVFIDASEDFTKFLENVDGGLSTSSAMSVRETDITDCDYNNWTNLERKISNTFIDTQSNTSWKVEVSKSFDSGVTDDQLANDGLTFEKVSLNSSEDSMAQSNTDVTEDQLNFQDIESDFFDDEDDDNIITPQYETAPPMMLTKDKKKHTVDTSVNSTVREPLYILAEGTSEQSKKTKDISNSVLRLTITELQHALSSSNKLLAQRDDEISSIRSSYADLKLKYDKLDEENRQMAESVAEKSEEIKNLEAKVTLLSTDIETLNLQISNLNVSLEHLREESQKPASKRHTPMSSPVDGNTLHFDPKISGKNCVRKTHPSNCSTPTTPTGYTFSNKVRSIESQRSKPTSSTSKQQTTEGTPYSSHCNQRRPTSIFGDGDEKVKTKQQQSTPEDQSVPEEKIPQRGVQAQLRITFMRDAFFYYMIGFHPDEQINAILSILEYGDKRQDFVLEAHRMRKAGKKFNATKVSSRSLTYVQETLRR